MKIARRGTASGRVQGVGFRYHTQREATRLGLGGWVRNLPGGRVEFEVVGERGAVEDFLAWLRQGPPFARVDELIVEECSPSAAPSFEIRR